MSSTLSEKMEIRAVIERYFYGLDSHSEEAVKSCFADDAFAVYHADSDTEHSLKSNVQIARYFAELTRGFDHTSHSISNQSISIDNQKALSDTFAVAHVVKNGQIFVRGLRYEDKLSLIDGAWRITERRHTPLWQHDAVDVKPDVSR